MLFPPEPGRTIWRNAVRDYADNVERYRLEAKDYPTDYLKGWLNSYESQLGPVQRLLRRLGRPDIPRAVAYKDELSVRQELSNLVD